MEFFDQAWPFADADRGSHNHQSTAELNRRRVLGLIVRRRCRSQRQVVLATGLRASTVSNIVRELKTLSIIREGELIDAERVGPKETELEMVPGGAWSVGAHFNADGHRLVVINAAGQILAREAVPGRVVLDEQIAALPRRITQLRKELGLSMQRFGGVGVTVPGVIDSEKGEILISRALKAESYPISAPLFKALKHPVWLERDVTCGAYAEHYVGAVRERPSFVYLMIRETPAKVDAFGLALVVEDRLFRGCHSAAGEIDPNLLRNCRVREAEQRPEGKVAPSAVDSFYRSLGISVGSVVNLLDLGCGVICCDDAAFTQERFNAMQESLCRALIPVPGRRFELIRSGIGGDGMVLGAALLGLHRHLASRLGGERTAESTPRGRRLQVAARGVAS